MALFAEVYAVRWLLLSVVFLFYLADKYRKYRRLQAFKGPFSSGWSEVWHSRAILSMQSHLRYKDVCDKYGIYAYSDGTTRTHSCIGSIARIGPNELITSSPELLVHMNAVRSPYTRSDWFNRATRVEPGKDHLFSQRDEEKHTKRRQQMAAGVSFSH